MCKNCSHARLKVRDILFLDSLNFSLGRQLKTAKVRCAKEQWVDDFGKSVTRQYQSVVSDSFRYNQRACDFFDGEVDG